jgi:hypothetical protein
MSIRILVFFLAIPMHVVAQQGSPLAGGLATIRVAAVDDSGAVIPGAHALLISLHTLETAKATADIHGRFFFNQVQPGTYELIVAPSARYSCVDSAVRRLRAKTKNV